MNKKKPAKVYYEDYNEFLLAVLPFVDATGFKALLRFAENKKSTISTAATKFFFSKDNVKACLTQLFDDIKEDAQEIRYRKLNNNEVVSILSSFEEDYFEDGDPFDCEESPNCCGIGCPTMSEVSRYAKKKPKEGINFFVADLLHSKWAGLMFTNTKINTLEGKFLSRITDPINIGVNGNTGNTIYMWVISKKDLKPEDSFMNLPTVTTKYKALPFLEGNKPSGNKPSGNKPSGNKPSGYKPSYYSSLPSPWY